MRSSALLLAGVFLSSALLLPADARAQSCGTGLTCNINGGSGFSVSNSNTQSSNFGIYGSTSSANAGSAGLYGVANTSVGGCLSPLPAAGVRGESWNGNGVIGLAAASATGNAGVSGYGVSVICNPGAYVYGQLGVIRTKFYGVWSGGDFGGTGAKYFVEPHPTDASKEIRYVSLEGPEAGTYFRGTGRVIHGTATIEIPESFRMVTDEEGLTVVVTPVGEMASLAVIRQDLNKIVVQGSKDVRFNYLVNGVRKAYRDFQAISENDDFVPDGPNDSRFFTLPAESQRRLVETGVYTSDGKVNLAKAHEMGWDRNWTASPGTAENELQHR